ncbi:MAG: hypothetical protein PHZ03_05200, partial [Syntrophomonas sp.]|nr:hypothetical protein [Syntrophomonas sp.]
YPPSRLLGQILLSIKCVYFTPTVNYQTQDNETVVYMNYPHSLMKKSILSYHINQNNLALGMA